MRKKQLQVRIGLDQGQELFSVNSLFCGTSGTCLVRGRIGERSELLGNFAKFADPLAMPVFMERQRRHDLMGIGRLTVNVETIAVNLASGTHVVQEIHRRWLWQGTHCTESQIERSLQTANLTQSSVQACEVGLR